jgi:hypothetical protein
MTSGSNVTAVTDVRELVALLLAQAGGRYIFGGKAPLSAGSLLEPFRIGVDCSGFIQWGTGVLGHPLNGGSGQQLAACRAAGLERTVPEGIATAGALLFIPYNGAEHVALSLGNGYTIEAHDTAQGIGQYPAAGRFSAAALIPGFTYTEEADVPLTPADAELVALATMKALDAAAAALKAGNPTVPGVTALDEIALRVVQRIDAQPPAAP